MNAPLTPCAAPGCGALVASGRCQAHSRQREQDRGTSAQRGYTRGWRQLRAAFLADPNHVLCAHCLRDGRVEPATEVHHMVRIADAPGLRLDQSNCLGLCKPCHSKVTRAEMTAC